MLGTMNDATSTPEQLTLLPEPNVPARFRLSRDTRVRGLRHVAEIKAMLAERGAGDDDARSLPPRRDQAA